MGCATSKQPPVCRNCQAECSPIRRSHSMHLHPPPSVVDEDDYHIVALTSTTLGSLKLDSIDHSYSFYREDTPTPPLKDDDFNNGDRRTEEFAMGLIEAKTWSQMIDEKIPKFNPRTPVVTPPGEPEMIDAWELMEGLEDISPLRPAHHLRSFSFQFPKPKLQEIGNSPPSPKPKWLEIAETDSISYSNRNSKPTSIISEFDPDVISSFREAMKDLPPANPFHIKPSDDEKEPAPAVHEPEFEKPAEIGDYKTGEKNRVVLYFTSLRGVRKTYEDCCHVRVILKGTGVRVDERDVSMHSGFKEELKELMEQGLVGGGGGGWLPRVFMGRKYIGGAEEIRQLHEEGQLEKLLDCCERAVAGGSCGGGGDCGVCGDIRFVPCETCSGSCKIYYEDDYRSSSNVSNCEDCEESEYGFQRCPDCNENGLVRCPICCD